MSPFLEVKRSCWFQVRPTPVVEHCRLRAAYDVGVQFAVLLLACQLSVWPRQWSEFPRAKVGKRSGIIAFEERCRDNRGGRR